MNEGADETYSGFDIDLSEIGDLKGFDEDDRSNYISMIECSI